MDYGCLSSYSNGVPTGVQDSETGHILHQRENLMSLGDPFERCYEQHLQLLTQHLYMSIGTGIYLRFKFWEQHSQEVYTLT